MNINRAKLAFFSPTSTTKRVVQTIAEGINPASIEIFDCTTPHGREQTLTLSKDELFIIGVPVYMGRVPGLLKKWLQAIKADNTPAVCVVVYGNRAYEDALLELKDSVKDCGCIPIAAAAYIGEHSFANSATPSKDRPNRHDLNHAHGFGEAIAEKLLAISHHSQLTEVEVPGSHPYGGITQLWDVDFISVSSACSQCGLCAELCPVAAIQPTCSAEIDSAKCITCCACIKKCPQRARTIKAGPVKDAQNRVNTLFVDAKKPELFF